MNLLLFPHQLFVNHPGLEQDPNRVILIEDSLFFGDYQYPMRFHKQKLWLHRATMKRFEKSLQGRGFKTVYLDYDSRRESLKHHLASLHFAEQESSPALIVAEPDDFILEKRLTRFCQELQIELRWTSHPGFLNSRDINREYRNGRTRWFMADFYKFQRKRLGILMEGDEPVGGKWSFDEDNRKKIPNKLLDAIPDRLELSRDSIDDEARSYVNENFGDNPGELEELYFPSSHDDAEKWLNHFLTNGLNHFGPYEDAIEEGESWLWHSVLTPSLNTGLLTPQHVVDATLAFAAEHEIPLNSLEGFVRQIIGWREFIRATYDDHGVAMRTTNHWNHRRALPDSFYTGTTGILPVDDTIQRLLKTGYCHHIERLMVLGGFMFLCEFDPDDVYRWFMEMFVDSYDWVMVPNVYAMSQHADGGLITTKPYFSGSSYIRKMSHYKKGDYCDIWDGLYWRWIWNHVDELAENPRWAMMCAMARKMDSKKRERHLETAERFLEGLDA